MAAVTRVLALAPLLAACLGKPDLPPAHGVSRSWHQRTDPVLPTDRIPDELAGPRLVYDPRRQRVILYGGRRLSDINPQDSMFELDPDTGWKLICDRCLEAADPVVGKGGRNDPAMVYDPIGDRVLLFGGDNDGATPRNDLFTLYGDTWSLVPTTTTVPSPRTQVQMVFDQGAGKMWLLGGYQNNALMDAFFLDESNVWTAAPTPSTPATMVSMTSPGVDSVYDPQRERVLLLENGSSFVSSELWQYTATSQWQMISETASTTLRSDAVMVHLPDYDQTFLIGGSLSNGDKIAGTEILVGDHFETYDAVMPPARSAPGIAYDPSRDVVVMYGGDDRPNNDDVDCNSAGCNGTWELRRD